MAVETLQDGELVYLLLECQSEPDPGRDVPRMACPVLDLRRWPDPGGAGNLAVLLARVRFGRALAGSLAALLEGITDADRLEDIGEWLLVCDSGEALLARLRQV